MARARFTADCGVHRSDTVKCDDVGRTSQPLANPFTSVDSPSEWPSMLASQPAVVALAEHQPEGRALRRAADRDVDRRVARIGDPRAGCGRRAAPGGDTTCPGSVPCGPSGIAAPPATDPSTNPSTSIPVVRPSVGRTTWSPAARADPVAREPARSHTDRSSGPPGQRVGGGARSGGVEHRRRRRGAAGRRGRSPGSSGRAVPPVARPGCRARRSRPAWRPAGSRASSR